MNPTGNATADLIFTGLLLVLHLAALAGLGYLLGRLMGDRRAKTAETLQAMWERHAGDAMRRARLAEDQVVGANHLPGDQLIPKTLAILEEYAKEAPRQTYPPTEDTGEPD